VTDYRELFPSRFLEAADFSGKHVNVKIEKVEREDLPGDEALESKWIVSFVGKKKQLVLNKTNATCIAAMFGSEIEAWAGHEVTLYPAPWHDPFRTGQTHCVRVAGSPELKQSVEVKIRVNRKPKKHRLEPTGKRMREPGED